MEKKLIELKKMKKARKPSFKRQQINQFKKLKNKNNWRKPKGIDSKMRLKRRGHRKMPNPGYSLPKKIRNTNKEGFFEIIVENVTQLKKIDSKTKVALISKRVGNKKKIEILQEAKKLNIKISNVKDIDKKIESISLKSKKKEEKKKIENMKKEEPKKKEENKEEDKKEDKKVEEKENKKEEVKESKKEEVKQIEKKELQKDVEDKK